MKINQSRLQRAKETQANEIVWKNYLDLLADNKLIQIIAVKRFFRCRPERLQKFIAYMSEVNHEFEEHFDDGRFEDKIREEIESYGIDYDSAHEFDTYEGFERKKELKKRSMLNEVEATRVQENFKAFSSFRKGNV